MRVSDLTIQNFRGIRTGRLTFGEFTVLVGANNCGKTTVIEALAALLGRERLVRTLTEHDFFGSTPGPDCEIRIIATITGFKHNDPEHNQDWFRFGRGISKWRDMDTGELRPERQKTSDVLACQIAFAGRFDRESLEVETARYFYDDGSDDDPFVEDSGILTLPGALVKDLGFFLVPANRTWDRAISFASELFRRVVAQVGGQPAEAVLDELGRLRSPDSPLERDEKLSALVAKVDADILDIFGRPSKLKLRLTTTDSAGVLEAVVPHFSEGEGVAVPARRQGSGLLSLQTLVLLLRFGHLRVQNGNNFLMAIEEPELHVPPSLQRRVLHLTQAVATQTIITTHSPTIAAVPSPHEVLVLVNSAGDLRASPLLPKRLAHDASSLERALFLSEREATVSAIMHPNVLIPEGKTDASWLRLLSRVADLLPSDRTASTGPAFAHEVGIIPTKNAHIPEVFTFLSNVHPSVSCLVDGDEAGVGYVKRLCALAPPPKIIIRWPDGWRIEDVIAWIISADPSALIGDDLQEAGIPESADNLGEALLDLKTNEIVHGVIADAIARNNACRARTSHVLTVLGGIIAGHPPSAGASAVISKNGLTMVWTFESDVSGI